MFKQQASNPNELLTSVRRQL